MTLTHQLGVEKYSKLFDNWCEMFPHFAQHATTGFYHYSKPDQLFIFSLRRCIVDSVYRDLYSFNAINKIKLATMVADFTSPNPWKVTGISEGDSLLVESALLSGLDTKTVAEEIANNSKITPWRKEY